MLTYDVQRFIEEKDLFNLQDKVLVALSGGADSVALLRVLLSLGYTCECAHCNFHLRGEESNRDENHVKDIVNQLCIIGEITHFNVDEYIKNGAGAVTVHAEIPGDVSAILRTIREKGVKAGVSVKPGTPAEAIKELLPLCDLVLVMTVEPGFGGQKFMPDMMPKIRALRGMGYKGQIMVDGGINAETAKEAVAAGADALVMGTALLKAEDPAAVVRACKELGE